MSERWLNGGRLENKCSGIVRLLRNVGGGGGNRHTEMLKEIGRGLKEVRNSVERVHRLTDLIDPNHLENIMLEMELQVCTSIACMGYWHGDRLDRLINPFCRHGDCRRSSFSALGNSPGRLSSLAGRCRDRRSTFGWFDRHVRSEAVDFNSPGANAMSVHFAI